MDNEKIYTLLEKMYIEFSQRFESVDERFDTVDKRLKFLEEGQCKLEQSLARIENEHGSKIDALFDGHNQCNKKLDCVLSRLDAIESKVESHDIQISVLDKRRKNTR